MIAGNLVAKLTHRTTFSSHSKFFWLFTFSMFSFNDYIKKEKNWEHYTSFQSHFYRKVVLQSSSVPSQVMLKDQSSGLVAFEVTTSRNGSWHFRKNCCFFFLQLSYSTEQSDKNPGYSELKISGILNQEVV